jgi:hypothetical protein
VTDVWCLRVMSEGVAPEVEVELEIHDFESELHLSVPWERWRTEVVVLKVRPRVIEEETPGGVDRYDDISCDEIRYDVMRQTGRQAGRQADRQKRHEE